MNRIYSLVWNRALRTVQVASELAHSAGGAGSTGAATRAPQRHPLALACVAALGMAVLALPAWSACPAGATAIGASITGTDGVTGSDGNGTAGGLGATADSGSYTCLESGYSVAGGYGGYAASTGGNGGSGGNGVYGNGFTWVNAGNIAGGSGGAATGVPGSTGGLSAVGGAGGIGVSGSDFTLTNYAGANISGGNGGVAKYGNGGAGGAAVSGSGFTLVNNGNVVGGAGGFSVPGLGADGTTPVGGGTGGAGGAGVTGSNFTLTNNAGGIYAGNGGVAFLGNGGAGGAGVSGSGFTLVNGARVVGGAGGLSVALPAQIVNGGTGYIGYGNGGAGGAGVTGTTMTVTNNAGGGIYGGAGGDAKYGNGGAGGTGVYGSDLTLVNAGYIGGGYGGSVHQSQLPPAVVGGAAVQTLDSTGTPGGSGYTGGAGGAGVVATGNSTITNTGTIAGGYGGEGYSAGVGSTGYGGAGGAGITGSGFKLTNQGGVEGGAGGAAYGVYGLNGSNATGGAGGAGVSGSGFYVSNSASIWGGSGGEGYAFGAATGGAGGAGIAGGGLTLVNNGFIAGGRGGDSYTYVSGAQSSGYVSTGGAGGAGVSIDNAAGATSSITNNAGGVIVGGESAGTAYEVGTAPAATNVTVVGNGGMGGAGISIAGAGATTVTNAGYIGGGYGGYAYVWEDGYQSAYTGNGGKGGDGISVAGSGTTTITNTGDIFGGLGGWAYSDGVDGGDYTPGAAGDGGAGINVSSTGTTTIDNSGYISGGEAGDGYGSLPASGGAGVTGTGFTLTNSGGIYGGYGNSVRSANGNEGGTGGAGVSGSGFTVTNTGYIGGGWGGSGKYSSGAGGAGISGSGFSVTNGTGGTIVGGNGGYYSGCGPATSGAGGVGVDAMGRASVINAGLIAGGLAGDGTQADAVDMSGGGNTLTLESGYAFTGNVVSSSGTTDGGDTLALGGATDDTFDVSQIVATAPTDWTGAVQYYGFANEAKTGTSTWTLTNTTTAVTPWTLEGGVLQISSDSNLGAASGGLTFNGGTLENTAAITTGRSITVQGAGTLQNDADFTSSGAVSGAGALTKTGAGTLTFNGDGSAFSGTTQVATGTLLVGGDGFASASLGGATTIAAGATLGGFGTLGSLDLFGTLSPGASIGTLHATGAATFESGSAYLLDITSAGQSDQFASAGAVAIKGGTVNVQATGSTWAPITKYTIVTGAGGVSGQFAGATNVPTAHWGLLYDPSDVYLILGTDAFNLADAAQTVNQRNTAGGMSSLGWGSRLFLAVAAQDAGAQRVAFDQTSGEFNASQLAALTTDSRFVREQMDKRLRDGDADAAAAKVAGTKLTAWVHGWGHWGQIDGDGNAAQMSDNGDGLLVGADLPVGASGRIGVTGGAERNSLSVHDRSSWADVTQTWLGTYGGFEQGAFAFRAGVAYAWNQVPANRQVALPMLPVQTLSSNTSGSTTTGYIEGAWNIQTAAGTFAPYLNLATVRVRMGQGNEAGGEAALHIDSGSMSTSLSTLGVRGGWQLASSVALDANLGWVHAFRDITPERTQQFLAGGDAFTVYGTPLAKDAGQVNVNLTWQVAPNAQVVLGYDGLYGSSIKDSAAKASFNVAF